MVDDLYVEKKSIDVTIFTGTGEEIKGKIFVALSSKFHPGRETIQELLINADSFIVFKFNEGISFMNKEYIKKILVSEEERPDIEGIEMKYEKCIVEFIDGERMECKIQYGPKQFRQRLSDFLNQAPRFFKVICGEYVYLANRNQVVSIELGD